MSQTLSTDEIMNIAKLARLGVNAEQADSYANDLSKILSMMDILAEVNTDNIAPLTNVHDMTQPLREDVIGGNGVEVNRELISPLRQVSLMAYTLCHRSLNKPQLIE